MDTEPTAADIRRIRDENIAKAKNDLAVEQAAIRTKRDDDIDKIKNDAQEAIARVHVEKKASKSKEPITPILNDIRTTRDEAIAQLKRDAVAAIKAGRVRLKEIITDLKEKAKEQIRNLKKKGKEKPAPKPKQPSQESARGKLDFKKFATDIFVWGKYRSMQQTIAGLDRFVRCDKIVQAKAIVTRDFSQPAVNRAYKILALEFHPDRVNKRNDLSDDDKFKYITLMQLLTSKRV